MPSAGQTNISSNSCPETASPGSTRKVPSLRTLSLPTLVTVVSPRIDVSSARPYVTSSGMKRHSASANCQSLSSVTDTCTDAVDPAGLRTMSAWAGTPNKAHKHAATHAKAAVAV